MPTLRGRLGAAVSCLLVLVTADASAQTAEPHAAGVEPIVVQPAEALPAAVAPRLLAAMPQVSDAEPAGENAETIEILPGVEIPLNKSVKSYLQQFTKHRTFLENGLARGAQYLPMIEAIFREEGLPQDLVYLPLIESAFRTKAVSHAGAAGLWQFMTGTATHQGLKRDWYVDERADPEKSTRAAARFLKTLHATFGDWHLALAAYNAGPGRVKQALRRSSQKTFWGIRASLPKETREYVPKFLASLLIVRDPVQHGFSALAPASSFIDTVALSGPLDLRRAADWLGISVDSLRALNPELRRWTTPVAAADYLLKVPAGLGGLLRRRLSDGPADDLARHVVARGETLATIARKLKVSQTDLAAANYMAVSARVQQGDALVIPRQPDFVPAPPTAFASAPADDSVPSTAGGTLSRLIHLVKPGDTIQSIASAYQTNVDYLKAWNGMVVDAVLPGQELTIVPGPLTDGSLHMLR